MKMLAPRFSALDTSYLGFAYPKPSGQLALRHVTAKQADGGNVFGSQLDVRSFVSECRPTRYRANRCSVVVGSICGQKQTAAARACLRGHLAPPRVIGASTVHSCVTRPFRNLKIRIPVIGFRAVPMMHNLGIRERAPYSARHHKPMLQHVTALASVRMLRRLHQHVLAMRRRAPAIPSRISSGADVMAVDVQPWYPTGLQSPEAHSARSRDGGAAPTMTCNFHNRQCMRRGTTETGAIT